ncbi:MAG TPA: hypothetical protein VGM90_10050 [Kofleriaceae bacterium]
MATQLGCPTCVMTNASVPVAAATAEGSGPLRIATEPNRFRAAASANGSYATRRDAATPPITAIIAADPIADVVAAASLLVRAAARVSPRQVLGAVLTLVTRAPRFLRS